MTPVPRRPWSQRLPVVLVGCALVVTTPLVLRIAAFELFRVPSTAMAPTLEPGSFVVAHKSGYRNWKMAGIVFWTQEPATPPRRGTVVVFRYPLDPSKTFVKRIVGVPGDRVSLANKVLSVNGVAARRAARTEIVGGEAATRVTEELDGVSYDTWIFPDRPVHGVADLEVVVPPGHYFMLGDNRDGSDDSRRWGTVPGDHLIGEIRP
jgi:signal peptidase I